MTRFATKGADLSKGTVSEEDKQLIVNTIDKWAQTLVEIKPELQEMVMTNFMAFFLIKSKMSLDRFIDMIEICQENQS